MYVKPVLSTRAEWAAYHRHLQSDHDYEVWADVLSMEEVRVSSVDILDGQINFNREDDGPDRTGSVVLSDPEGALAFGTSFTRDATDTLWVNRLLRVRHRVDVPGLGKITATPLVGVPTAVSRQGGEVSLELGDKSLLADHGVRPHHYKRGTNVADVLKEILYDLTGERHFRIPTTRKTLSRGYTVGMGEDVMTPWAMFKRIADREMGWRAFYSCDGYATCESTRATRRTVVVEHLLSLPDSSASFTDFSNYARVTSKRKVKVEGKPGKKDDRTIDVIYEGVAVLPLSHDLSEQSLSRNGVRRTLPLVVGDDSLKTQKDVNKRAVAELKAGSGIDSEQSFEVMPFFHLDMPDRFDMPEGIGVVGFNQVSIPLGVNGNMTLGSRKWVSKPVKVKRVRSKRTVVKKKKKGGKKSNE